MHRVIEASGHPVGAAATREPRVLIADDHADTREVYSFCLVAAGWRVLAVENGAEALAAAETFDPDVIVMNLEMPVLDGLEATRRLKEDPRTAPIPIVGCTAFASLHSRGLEEAGFVHLLAKPCLPDDLREVLDGVLAKKNAAR